MVLLTLPSPAVNSNPPPAIIPNSSLGVLPLGREEAILTRSAVDRDYVKSLLKSITCHLRWAPEPA